MKKLINDPRHVVREMLEGVVTLAPGLALLPDHDVVVRDGMPSLDNRGVAVISGGGAGHEPAHAGYVGRGMLHAAVAGPVFTSPSPDAVFAAIRAVAGPRGAVLIVKNYTGDRLNFGMAAEMARAIGIPVEIVIVADDVALRDLVAPDRRRGIAGTVLVHKIAGAAAEAGAPLAEVAAAGRAAAAAVGTMGVSLGACTIPGAGVPGFTLGPDEIELGLGIHGEAGVRRIRLPTADALVDEMLAEILADRGFGAGERVVLLVNNLGATPPMELAIVARRAVAALRERGLTVARCWTGTALSALDMPGCSLSVMNVDDVSLSRLDETTAAPAWLGSGTLAERLILADAQASDLDDAAGYGSADAWGACIQQAALACAAALEAAEAQLTALDSATGDGDLGISMVRAAEAVRGFCATDAGTDAASTLARLAGVLRRVIGGSSGPFYATGLLRAARHLTAEGGAAEPGWVGAARAGVEAISELGGARAGDRTMLDALLPAVDALATTLRDGAGTSVAWSRAAQAAREGAAATAQMLPRVGRSSYLGQRALGSEDGGAVAVAICILAIADVRAEVDAA